jgi:regulator of protease activity HflC (stomatin/prohibitin superfamily)
MSRDPWSLEEEPPRKRGWWRLVTYASRVFATLLVLGLAAVLLYRYVIVTVPSGQVGVLFKRFPGPGIYCLCIQARGTVLNPAELRDEGLHLILPWDILYLYDLRLQSQTQTFNAISADGVSVIAQISYRYQLAHDSVAVLHKYIGPDYVSRLLTPVVGSQARTIIAQYTAQQVYVSRQNIEREIKAATKASLDTYMHALFQVQASEQAAATKYQQLLQDAIEVLDTLVLDIQLPAEIVAAINRQTDMAYQIQEYKFRAEREMQESKRKQIEADGIAAFQQTVTQGISESYLRWQGIQATLSLAMSPNTKIVIIGSGKDGLPVILGNIDAPSATDQKSANGGQAGAPIIPNPSVPGSPTSATGVEK